MIMFNRVILSFVVVCAIFTLSIVSPNGETAYSSELKRDKPLFQSDDLATVLIWAGIDINKEVTHMIETDNYIHKINPDLHFTTISHKTEDYKFVGVNMMALYIPLRNGIWSVYNVPFEDQYNPITMLYRAMLVEFYKTGKECPKEPKHNEFKKGMTVL